MPLVDAAIELVFGSLYGALVMLAAFVAAIPYGVWLGIRRLGHWIGGRVHGDARADR